MSVPEAVAVGIVVVFALLGAMRGLLRQVLTVLLFGVAFAAAAGLYSHLAPLATKVSGLEGTQADAVAWSTTWFLALAIGGIGLSLGREWIGERGRGGPTGRTLAGLLGAAQGAFLLVAGAYLVLGWTTADSDTTARPSLRRETPAPTLPDRAQTDWRARLQASTAARWALHGGALLKPIVPAGIRSEMERVESGVAR